MSSEQFQAQLLQWKRVENQTPGKARAFENPGLWKGGLLPLPDLWTCQVWEERSRVQDPMWDMPEGWKSECVWWRNWMQLLHEREATCCFLEAGRRRKCTVETLFSWARWNEGRVFYEANKCLQQLPGQTSERSSADWNVNSWLCAQLQGRVSPGPSGESSPSDRADGGAGGRSRPAAASRKRQRKRRE